MPMTKGLQVIPSCDPDDGESGFKSSASHEGDTGYRGRGYDRDESQERMILWVYFGVGKCCLEL
jgi:hypothetical protein